MGKFHFFIGSESIPKTNLRGVNTPLFLCYNRISQIYLMDKERLKLIVRNLELLVDSLKAEVYSDVSAYTKDLNYEDVAPHLNDYDEIFDDDDGYPD